IRTRGPIPCSASEAGATRSRPKARVVQQARQGQRSRREYAPRPMTRTPTAHRFTRKATGADAVALRAWEWPGDGAATLLLQGIGNYGRYWDFFADAVAGRLRLIATDARGHGESGKPPDGYAPQEFVADALGVLDALAIERAVIVGHSMGGTH